MTGFQRNVLLAAALMLSASPSNAPARDPSQNYKATEATIERIMDTAVNNISIRYNLNDLQREKTDEIMKTHVRQFIKEHEHEIWPILRDLIATQFGGVNPEDPNDAIRLGKAAKPLAKLAQKAILEGNAKWRKILNEEQKRTHDFDLEQMGKTFEMIDEHFESWAQGKPMGKKIFGNRTDQKPTPPPHPARPRDGEWPGLEDPAVDDDWPKLTFLGTMVEEFIKEYSLDEGQIDSARSILKEIERKAADFKSANKTALRNVANAMRESQGKIERAKTDKKRKMLLGPIYALVGEMNGRLRALLNKGQLHKYEAAHQTAQASADKPKGDVPKTDGPKTDGPKTDASKADKTTNPDAKKTPPSEPASPDTKPKSDAS